MFVCLYASLFGVIFILLPTVSPFLLLPIEEIATISGTIACATGESSLVVAVNLCAIRVYYSNDAASQAIVRNGLWSKNVLRRMINNQNCTGFSTGIDVGVGTCDPMSYEMAVNMTLCICAETGCNTNLATCIASVQNFTETGVFSNFISDLSTIIDCALPMNFDYTCSQHNLINRTACEEYVRTKSVLCSVTTTSSTSILTRNAFIENNYELYIDQGSYQLVQALRSGVNVTVNSTDYNVYYVFFPVVNVTSQECLCINNSYCNVDITTCWASQNNQIDATTISNQSTVASSLADSLASTAANVMSTADSTSRSTENLSTDMSTAMLISQSTSNSNMDLTSFDEISTVTNTMNANQVTSTLMINDETSTDTMNPTQTASAMVIADETSTDIMNPTQVVSTMTIVDETSTDTVNPTQTASAMVIADETSTNTLNIDQVTGTLMINDETSTDIMNPTQVVSTMAIIDESSTNTLTIDQVTSTVAVTDETSDDTIGPNQTISTLIDSITTLTEQMSENPSTLVDSMSESTTIRNMVTENLSTVNRISDASTQINTNSPDETTESVQIVTENPSTISETTPSSRTTVGTNTDEATMESTGIATVALSTISDGVNTNNPTSLLTSSTTTMISITSESTVGTTAIDTIDSMSTMMTSSKATTESVTNTNTNAETLATSASISSTVSLASSNSVPGESGLGTAAIAGITTGVVATSVIVVAQIVYFKFFHQGPAKSFFGRAGQYAV